MERKRFTRAFEEEAVRLLRTSGRTKREIGEDLGVSLSTLTRWLARARERRWKIGAGALRVKIRRRS